MRYLDVLGLLNGTSFEIFVAEKIVIVFVAVLFIYINYRGASETGKIGALFTLGQTLFLLFIGIIGILVVIKDPSRLENFDPFLPKGWHPLLVTMGFTYVAFEGYEVIAQTGDEAINPRKNLPKAMLYSVFIVTITYILVAFATVVSVKAGSAGMEGQPWEWIGQFRERGFGEAIARLLPMGNLLLTLAVIFAATSALNATIYSATRALYALGRDNMVPSFFSRISRKTKTPWIALFVTAVLLMSVALFLPTMDVASSASMMFLMLFFLVNICVIRVRVNMGDELQYGFVMPFFPLFPVFAIVMQAVLTLWLVHMSLVAWVITPCWVVTGVIIYNLYSFKHAKYKGHEIRILEEETAEVTEGYRIMVAVANPKNAIEMVRTTYHLCGAKKAHVELLHMVQVPDQVPLTDAEKYMLVGKEAIVETMLYLEPLFPVSTTIRYCRNISRGIVSALKQKRTNMLIMGWHGGEASHRFTLGSTIDPTMERSPCNVVILKGGGNHEYKRILVPLAGGPNGAFSLEIASILADKKKGTLTAFTVVKNKPRFDIEAFVYENKSSLDIPIERVSVETKHHDNIIQAVLEKAHDYDLVVLGCTRKSVLYQVTHESIPETIARQCAKPVVMVHATTGLKSWIKRWI